MSTMVALASPSMVENATQTDEASMELEPQTSTLTNADIDSLVRGLGSVAIQDMAVAHSKSLPLPKGYPMTNEVKPMEFYLNIGVIRRYVKRKREEGVLRKDAWLDQRNGFQPHEVIQSGAVSLRDCRTSDLCNDIHPLLVRSRFDDTPDAIYDQLIPALRLASMFLTQPICMQFWVTLAFGQRRDDQEMINKFGQWCQRIDEHVEMTNENTAKAISQLKELGEMNVVHFSWKDKIPSAWGFSKPICDFKKTTGPKGLLSSVIKLHSDWFVIANKLRQLKYPEVSQELRFDFLFANLIMHELAHSVEGASGRLRYDQLALAHRSNFSYLEPFWLDSQRPPECGRAFEQTMFGGEIQPINNRCDGSHGIGTSEWPPQSHENDPERRIWFTVPMAHVEKLFQTSTWQQSYDLKDWNTFHIPRTGAVSAYTSCFTTMSWSEPQRVADAELAEIVETVNAEPAPKIRIKYSGDREEHRLCDEQVIEQAVKKQGKGEGERNDLPKTAKTEEKQADKYVPNGLTPGQVERLAATTHKAETADKASEAAKKMNTVGNGKEPTSEIVKRLRTQPLGIREKWLQRKRVEAKRKAMAIAHRYALEAKEERNIKEALMKETDQKEEQKEDAGPTVVMELAMREDVVSDIGNEKSGD